MRVAIGITIYNEERNIGALLARLRDEPLAALGVDRVVVVSSGSTDRSDAVVGEVAATWPLVRLIVEPVRRGKASAINLFLEAARGAEVCLLMSGDVLPEPGALAKLVDAIAGDARVGMAGGRPVPRNQGSGGTRLIHQIVRLQWDLHHEVSLVSPKLGEVVAFRNVLDRIPADTAVDEASIEGLLRDRGYAFRYVADAIIWNKGPETIADFLKQRRRIAAGHHHLTQTQSHTVSTGKNGLVAGIAARALLRTPSRIPVALAAAGLEAWGRMLGLYDLWVRKKNPVVWDIAKSTKDLGADDLGTKEGARP